MSARSASKPCSLHRERTSFFCFVHKRPCCERCLVEADKQHANCFIGQYANWIADSDYVPLKCGVCYKPVPSRPREVVRLPCMCVHHRACLAAHVGRVTSTFACPTCSTTVNPADGGQLVAAMRVALENAPRGSDRLSQRSSSVAVDVIEDEAGTATARAAVSSRQATADDGDAPRGEGVVEHLRKGRRRHAGKATSACTPLRLILGAMAIAVVSLVAVFLYITNSG